MKLSEELLRLRQIAEMLALALRFHWARATVTTIDEPDGALEQGVSAGLGRRVLAELDMPVTLVGAERVRDLTNYCVVSSHASYLDWALILGHFPVPVRFVARASLTPIPVIGAYLKRRAILIDRAKGRDARSAIEAAVKDGQPWPILIFAEGTRSPDGEVQPFKPGGLRILADAGLTMVPVGIHGTFDAFPRQARAIKRGRPLQMVIGEPLANTGDADGMIREIEARVRGCVEQARRLATSAPSAPGSP